MIVRGTVECRSDRIAHQTEELDVATMSYELKRNAVNQLFIEIAEELVNFVSAEGEEVLKLSLEVKL